MPMPGQRPFGSAALPQFRANQEVAPLLPPSFQRTPPALMVFNSLCLVAGRFALRDTDGVLAQFEST